MSMISVIDLQKLLEYFLLRQYYENFHCCYKFRCFQASHRYARKSGFKTHVFFSQSFTNFLPPPSAPSCPLPPFLYPCDYVTATRGRIKGWQNSGPSGGHAFNVHTLMLKDAFWIFLSNNLQLAVSSTPPTNTNQDYAYIFCSHFKCLEYPPLHFTTPF